MSFMEEADSTRPRTFVSERLRDRCLLFRGGCAETNLLPSLLASILAPVHKFFGLQIIFRYFGAFPFLHEILIEHGVETVVILAVLQEIFGHGLDIQRFMIMLHPNVIAQDGQFDVRDVGIQLEFDVLMSPLEAFQNIYALPDLLGYAFLSRRGMLYGTGACFRRLTIRV